MTKTVLQCCDRGGSPVIPNARKISRLIVAVAALGGRVTGMYTTARNDEERVESIAEITTFGLKHLREDRPVDGCGSAAGPQLSTLLPQLFSFIPLNEIADPLQQ